MDNETSTKSFHSKADELEERLIDFAVRIIKLSASLPKILAGKHIAGQILRSGTSPFAIRYRLGHPFPMRNEK